MKIINGIELRTKEEKLKPIEKTKNINILHTESICSSQKNMSSENYPRRTLSIAPNVNRWIQNFRALSLQKYPEHETDYTSVANFLMALGIIFVENFEVNEKIAEKLNTMLGNFKQLKTFGILDLYDTLAKEKTTDK